jgi:hypothetical protein
LSCREANFVSLEESLYQNIGLGDQKKHTKSSLMLINYKWF